MLRSPKNFIGTYFVLLPMLTLAGYLLKYFFRVLVISVRGWPPAHLNADDDINEYEDGNQQDI